MVDLILEHKAEYVEYSTIMDVYVKDETRNKDILPYLKLVKENKTISPEKTNTDFFALNNQNHPYGMRWIEMMMMYGFVEHVGNKSYRLTQAAENMVEDEQILIPCSDMYKLQVSKDPIFENTLIGCNSEKLDIFEEIREQKKKISDRKPIKETYSLSENEIDNWKQRIKLPLNNDTIEIIDVNRKAVKKDGEKDLKIIIENRSLDQFITKIKYGNDKEKIFKNNNFTADVSEILENIAWKNGLEYDDKTQRIRIGISELEKISDLFELNLPKCEIDLDIYGKYTVLKAEKIPAVPEDLETAVKWVISAILKEIKKQYITEKDYERIVEEKIEMLPISEDYKQIEVSENVPDYKKFVEEIKSSQKGKIYWHTMAVLDLTR